MTEPQINKLPALWTHQKTAIDRADNRFALFFDPGCGKSRTAIELYRRKVINRNLSASNKVLIFAPLNVCRNWQNELAEYLGAPYKVFLCAGGTKIQKTKVLEQFKSSVSGGHQFLICNIESLRSLVYRSHLAKCGASFVIVDESHNFKSPTSQQTKGLFTVVDSLKPLHLYLLTGTPAPQGEIDLWSTFTLLGVTTLPFFVWRRKFFIDKNERRRGMRNYWPEYVPSAATKQHFRELLGQCSAVAKKSDVLLDLPPLLRTNIYAEMSGAQAKHYQTMLEYLFAVDTDGNELNAANMLSRTLRLQQILAGFLGETPVKDNPRLEALSSAIERTNGDINEPHRLYGAGEQFIIWTIFKATYNQIGGMLSDQGISYGLLTGNESAEQRHEYMEQFQAGKLRALIAHPKAGGVGVNLTAASYSIHYTRSFSLTDDLQTEARNYRGGSEIHQRITRIDIITPDTIDEEIVKALREKKSVMDFILGLKEKHNGRDRKAA